MGEKMMMALALQLRRRRDQSAIRQCRDILEQQEQHFTLELSLTATNLAQNTQDVPVVYFAKFIYTIAYRLCIATWRSSLRI